MLPWLDDVVKVVEEYVHTVRAVTIESCLEEVIPGHYFLKHRKIFFFLVLNPN
jgi:hypothetical protein